MTEIKFQQAISFQQNGRQGWVTKLTVEEISLLTMPSRSGQLSLFHITNREIEDPHVKSIARYLESPDWAFPAIILAVRPGAFGGKTKTAALQCDAGDIKVLDGQHRIKALTSHTYDGRRDILAEELAVTVIEVKDDEDQARIWLDFAKNKQISGAWRGGTPSTTPRPSPAPPRWPRRNRKFSKAGL